MFKKQFCTSLQHITLVYTITQSEKGYSITVTERIGRKKTSDTLTDVTDSYEEAEKIARFFCENAVTCAHAYDIWQEQFCSLRTTNSP